MSCGIGHRPGSDPMLLWLWRRPTATALIGPLAWEPPYAESTALEKTKTNKQTKIPISMVRLALMTGIKNPGMHWELCLVTYDGA